MAHREMNIEDPKEKERRAELAERTDAEGLLISRFLGMPDLSRTPGSPLSEIVNRALQVKSLQDFDVIKIPEIVPTRILFDLFNMPPGPPPPSTSDTYY